MSGALLLHTASRSRTPAEAAIGDPERIAEIAAFAWELGGGSICEVLSFPASGKLPSWAIEDDSTVVLYVSANLSEQQIYELGEKTAAALLDQNPVILVCGETFGQDFSLSYWQGFTSAVVEDNSEDMEALWTQVRNLICDVADLISVIMTSPRTLSSPPPSEISKTNSALNISQANGFLPSLRRIYEKNISVPSKSWEESNQQVLFSQLPAAGGGISALFETLGVKSRTLGSVVADTDRVHRALAECTLVISMVDELNTWQVSSWFHQNIVEAANERALPCILVAKNSSLNRMEMADLGIEARYEVRSSMEPDVVKVFSRLARTWGRV